MCNKKHLILAAVLSILTATACTDDAGMTPAEGTPVVLKDIRIGAQTKADPYEPDLKGRTLRVGLDDGTTENGIYTYNGTTWTADPFLYWPSATKTYTVTLATPTPTPAQPDAFTADNWLTYDLLSGTVPDLQAGQAVSATLSHTQGQLCVTLSNSTDIVVDEVSANGIGLMAHNGSYYGLFADKASLNQVTVTTTDGMKYTYTPESAPTFTAGQCLRLTLTLNQAGVTWKVTSEEWQEVTATGTEVPDVTVLNCTTPGSLTVPDALSGTVYITGTINNNDLTALKGKLGSVTHLYILAESGTEELTVPENFAKSSSLQTVVILHATGIGGYAFDGCSELTSIELPRVKTIGKYAFQKCRNLTNIELPQTETIEFEAFNGCTSLTSIELPQAETIVGYTFTGCTSLTSIELPRAETIGDNAFYYCTNLTSIELPQAKTIEGFAFYYCSSLTQIALPSTTTINNNAFSNCNSLTTLFFTDAEATAEVAQSAVNNGWGGHTGWQTVYYGYKGSGDYLDPANYEHKYPNN